MTLKTNNPDNKDHIVVKNGYEKCHCKDDEHAIIRGGLFSVRCVYCNMQLGVEVIGCWKGEQEVVF